MEFLATFLTALIANGVINSGIGIRDAEKISHKKPKWLLLAFFFVESLILGGVSIGLSALGDKFEIFSDFSVLILVVVMVLITALFLFLKRFLPAKLQEGLSDSLVEIGVNSALLAIAAVVMSASSWLVSLATMIALPFAYAAMVYAIEPLMERISIANAPKGFKGIPLLLLCIACLALCLTQIKF